MNKTGEEPCQICGAPEFLVEHHIRGREIEHCNHPDNLCYICSNCHFKIHKGVIVIEGWFMTSLGRTLLHFNKNTGSSLTGNKAEVHLF